MFPRIVCALLASVVVFCSAPVSLAHVTVAPKEAPPGATQRYCIKVPTEKSIPTVGLEVEFPEGLTITSIEAPNGWKGKALKDRQGRIVSASWEGGNISPGQSLEFGVVAQNPETPTTLVWKAIQKYQDGSEVHWIGPSRAQFPAARTSVKKLKSGASNSEFICAQESSSSSTGH